MPFIFHSLVELSYNAWTSETNVFLSSSKICTLSHFKESIETCLKYERMHQSENVLEVIGKSLRENYWYGNIL